MHLSTLTSVGLTSILFNALHAHGQQQLLRGGGKLAIPELPSTKVEHCFRWHPDAACRRDRDRHCRGWTEKCIHCGRDEKVNKMAGECVRSIGGNDREVETIQILPLDIPLDRVFDVQWNPPGYPELRASFLQPPYNDLWTTRDGHYTFAKQKQNGVMSLVRKKTDGTVCSVFEKVDFRAISEEVLMMEGDELWGVGSGFGTMIKGKRIHAGDEGGIWNTAAVDTVEIAEQWLMKNFHQQDSAATIIDAPIKSCSESEEVETIQILPLDIPLDRVFDVQWNPPGYPELRASFLQPPYNDLWTTRDGHYTFAKQIQDGVMSLVRKKTDGTVCSVFEKVDFRAISEEVLMMEGDELWGVGSGFGTMIKGKRIHAGDEGGIWNTAAVDTVEIAEQWLMQNFYQQDSAATIIDAPIKSCSESDLMLLSDTPATSSLPRYEDTPVVEGGGKSLIGMMGDEAKAAIEAINPSLQVILCPKQKDRCFTRDLRDDRVRIFVDKHGKVTREPKRG